MPSVVRPERVRTLSAIKKLTPSEGGIVYWMSRDQRVQDNWALLHARDLAVLHGVPFSVAFCLVPVFLQATIRQFGFMLRGLEEVERELRQLHVPFVLLTGAPEEQLPEYICKHDVCGLVTDFSPLRISRAWKDAVVAAVPNVPVYEVRNNAA